MTKIATGETEKSEVVESTLKLFYDKFQSFRANMQRVDRYFAPKLIDGGAPGGFGGGFGGGRGGGFGDRGGGGAWRSPLRAVLRRGGRHPGGPNGRGGWWWRWLWWW